MRRVALALALLAALSTAASGAAPDCRALGFTGFSLCSSCDALESAVHDAGAPYSSPACAAADDAGRARAELAAECRQCCAADDSDGADAGPFDSAVLEVCPCCSYRGACSPAHARMLQDYLATRLAAPAALTAGDL